MHTSAGSRMKNSEDGLFVEVIYDVWPATSSSVLYQNLRQVSFLISVSDQE